MKTISRRDRTAGRLASLFRPLRIAVALPVFALGIARAQMATPGELILAEDFRTHATYTKEKLPVQDGWQVRVAHGIWTRTAEGVQAAWEPGKHSPVLVYEGSFGDAILEIDFRYREEPGRWAAFRMSATNNELNPRAYAVCTWANVDFKSRAVGLVLEHDEWSPGHITQVNRKMTEFKPDTWYTMRMEIIGDMAVSTCNGVTVKGRFDKFGIPKTSIWLGTGETTFELRKLRVYRAVKNLKESPNAKPAAAAAK